MNSLFDLCEYGLKVRECQKLRLASITPKNIILSDIKINNDLKNAYTFKFNTKTSIAINCIIKSILIFNK